MTSEVEENFEKRRPKDREERAGIQRIEMDGYKRKRE